MFKNEAEVTIKNAETIIGPSIKVKGNFFGEGDIIVEGILEGEIKTSKNLIIGPKAVVNANIRANQAKISGEVHGNINVGGYLELTASAKILGNIEAAKLSIEPGAFFNGQCLMGDKEEKNSSEKK